MERLLGAPPWSAFLERLLGAFCQYTLPGAPLQERLCKRTFRCACLDRRKRSWNGLQRTRKAPGEGARGRRSLKAFRGNASQKRSRTALWEGALRRCFKTALQDGALEKRYTKALREGAPRPAPRRRSAALREGAPEKRSAEAPGTLPDGLLGRRSAKALCKNFSQQKHFALPEGSSAKALCAKVLWEGVPNAHDAPR